MIIASYDIVSSELYPEHDRYIPEPTPVITKDRTLLMVGNSLTEAIAASMCVAVVG